MPTISDLADRPPVPAVTGVGPVVAHDEVVVGGNPVGAGQVGAVARRAGDGDPLFGGREPALVEALPVDVDVATREGDDIAREPDDPLDEVVHLGPAAVLGRRAREDHDVAAVDPVEVVAQLVDEDAVADLQRRLHRPGGDEERLDDERPQEDRHQDGDHDDDDRLLDPARRMGVVGRRLGGVRLDVRRLDRRRFVDGEHRIVRVGRHRRQARRRRGRSGLRRGPGSPRPCRGRSAGACPAARPSGRRRGWSRPR